MVSKRKPRKLPLYLILVFLLLNIGIIATGSLYYHNQKEHILQNEQNNLLAIADLKVKQIVDWRKERLGDAAVIQNNPFYIRSVKMFFENPTASELKQEILTWMSNRQKYYQYRGVFLLDIKGNVRLSVPDVAGHVGSCARTLAAESLRTKQVIFSDFHRGETSDDIHIDLFIPLLVQGDRNTISVGVLLIQLDPKEFLYPLIQSWPTPSKTAEALLIRHEGNGIVYLNELRHQKNTALTLRFPISEQHLPEVMAVGGIEGIVEGIDYRGIPVLAALRTIPYSPWFLIAKVDKEEVYAPIRERALIVTIFITILIIAAGLSIGLFWRHQRALFYRKQYETELERQALAERYRFLSKYANDIILLFDKEWKIVEANDRAISSYGYAYDELLRLSLMEIQLPETQELLKKQLNKLDEQNGIIFETLQQRKDGSTLPVEISSRIIEIEGKKFYQCIIRDITERKMAEAAIRYRVELEKVIATISTNFINIIPDEIDIGINHALRTIGEFSLVDRSYVFLFSEDKTKMVNTHEWYAEGIEPQMAKLRSLPVQNFPWWMEKLNRFENIYIPRVADLSAEASAEKEILQSQSIQSLIVVPMVYGGLLFGFLGFDSVRTEKKWLEEDIALLKMVGEIFVNALERKEAWEEKENIYAQLLRAQKMEAVGTLAGGIAHDFNNLLTAIQGYAELSMMAFKEGDREYHYLKELQRASMRAAGLIHQLLLFSRKQPIEVSPLNMNKTVDDLLKLLNRLIREDITIITELEPDLWTVIADAGTIEQVIMNLTVNARDAIPRVGKITIKTENIVIDEDYCKVITDALPGKFVCLSISDTGIGMDKETMQHIFEPFFTTKEPGTGTGLGMSVVYGIVKQHKGWLNLYSEPGFGSTFKVYLPASSLKIEVGTKETIPLKELKGKGERILLVEDEESIREFTKRALSENGYVVFEAASARETFDTFEREKGEFDLVLSDVVLTDTNGFHLVEQLISRKPGLRVLLSSGYADQKSQWPSIQERKFRLLQKPYSLLDVLKAVREVIE